MPIHDYYCKNCGHEYETLISNADKDAGKTPSCKRCGCPDGQIRQMSAPGFVIHGYSAANGYASRNRFGTGESEAGEQII